MKKDRLKALSMMFGKRLAMLPFTDEGIPSREEAQLTKDLWSSLTDDEKDAILKNTTEMVAEDYRGKMGRIPDQTPYAMRLTHKYLKLKLM